MNKRNIAYTIVVLALIGSLFTVQSFFTDRSPVAKEQITNKSIHYSQKISMPSGQKKEFNNLSADRKNNLTALKALKDVVAVQTNGEGINAFITSIDNRKADDAKKEFWAFYVNGKQAELGAGSYVIKNNDTIEWKIETY